MTMTINNEHKKLNVPNLRFPEFQGEWEKKKLEECVEFLDGLRKPIKSEDRKSEQGLYPYYGASGIIDYIDGYIFDGEYILLSEDGANIIDRNYRVSFIAKGKIWVNNHAHVLQPYDGFDINFLSETLERLNYAVYNTGTTMPKLNQEVCRNINLKIPTTKEQNKIGNLLSLLNERIATQNKIIDKLQSLIKGIAQHCIRDFTNGCEYVRLGDICKITTGKLDANAQVENGQYPFFTCAERPFNIDNYAFDTEALLISGNGANLGYINYYKGKFNAYQRTYVLDHVSMNIQYVKWALKVLLPKRIAIEKSSSNTPYIVLSTLEDLKIPIPNRSKQKHMANLMLSFERKLSNQLALNILYNKQKQYLLRQMFI